MNNEQREQIKNELQTILQEYLAYKLEELSKDLANECMQQVDLFIDAYME